MYVCMYVRMYACMYACMHVCMYTYVCMYVCMHTYMCTYNIASYIQTADARANICKAYRACRCIRTNKTALALTAPTHVRSTDPCAHCIASIVTS